MAYESPIHLYMTDIQTQLIKKQEDQILKAVQSVAVGVDHDELFRALKYDREQYEKGYQDGKPKWIPVSERLPDHFGVFIVAIKEPCKERMGKDCADFDPFAKTWLTSLCWDRGYKVTHWMELPEPPKGDL